jgi:small GTP-binding protein
MEKLIKIITLGASAVGKTSIIKRIVQNKFDDEMQPTYGIDNYYLFRDYKKKNVKIKLKFIDTVGQEKHSDLPNQYIRDCHIVLLIFKDIKTLDELKNRWFKLYKENANVEKSKFIVVANQSDTFGIKRNEIKNSGKLFAEEMNNSIFITCSAKSEDNIDHLEDYILEEAKNIIDDEEKENTSMKQNTKKNTRERGKSIKIDQNKNNNDKTGCCKKSD